MEALPINDDWKTCSRCNGTGKEPGGWTLSQARANPHEYHKQQLEKEYGPGHKVRAMLGGVVSPIPFVDGCGVEKCYNCAGTGHSREYTLQLIKEKRQREADEKEQETKRITTEYKHLKRIDDKTSSHAMGAKNIRTELKSAFPGHNFSVRSESFSGGNSIDIYWTDGPNTEEVETITRKYQRGYFDGMTDTYNFNRSPWSDIFGGAKYVHTHREVSEEHILKLAKEYGYIVTEYKWGDLKGDNITPEMSRSIIHEARNKSYYTA